MEFDEIEVEEIYAPQLGDPFPELEVKTTKGMIKLPDFFKGKWFVLFSHPADFTPVCTTEFVAFARRHEEFRKLNCELIGLSIDQVFSHIKWLEWIEENLGIKVDFPVIADDTGMVADLLGMISPSKGSNTVRAVFIVDPEGKIRAVLYYPQEVGRNVDEILRLVKALQVSDEKNAAVPANWPDNELVGDDLIVPPASSVEEKKEREEAKARGEIECFDWWFCHRTYSNDLKYLLERAVIRELQVSIQYMWQHVKLEGTEIGKRLKAIAIQEMKHAEDIAERLVELGGVPPTKPSRVRIGESPREMMELDAEDEEGAVRLYTKIIRIAKEKGDSKTAELFERVLRDEEEHLKFFRSQQ